MKKAIVLILWLCTTFLSAMAQGDVIIYEAEPAQISFHWLDNMGMPITSMGDLLDAHPNAVCAMNGGLFGSDLKHTPLGLYIENGKVLNKLRKVRSTHANFGLQPQGVFLITTDNKAMVVDVDHPAVTAGNIKWADQSAPLLVINNRINPKLPRGNSLQIRNGVGILPNGNVLFIVSKKFVSFTSFAKMFLERGCTNAMYLDGGLSDILTPKLRAFEVCRCYSAMFLISKP
ncbi:MAG: hypothetical protein EOO06_09370 [Chitinophagaceae bacterium]|nr:MAG: hypothetical protein EOO06_09370 [Chitinophagaceae bacterium]